MIKTNYKSSISSPFQIKRKEVFSVRNKKDPVHEEIEKNIGTYNLTAKVEEDRDTLSLFKHVPGLIAFKTTVMKGNEVLGVGRGTATLNRMNKFVERGVRYAYCASLIDAIVRSTKTLDALYLKPNSQKDAEVSTEETGEDQINDIAELATDRQKSYLRELININVDDESERNSWQSQIDELTKDEASEAIQSFKR